MRQEHTQETRISAHRGPRDTQLHGPRGVVSIGRAQPTSSARGFARGRVRPMEAQGWVLLWAPRNQTQMSTGPSILGGDRLLWSMRVLHSWMCGEIGVTSQMMCSALTTGGHTNQRVQIHLSQKQAGETHRPCMHFVEALQALFPAVGGPGKRKSKSENYSVTRVFWLVCFPCVFGMEAGRF